MAGSRVGNVEVESQKDNAANANIRKGQCALALVEKGGREGGGDIHTPLLTTGEVPRNRLVFPLADKNLLNEEIRARGAASYLTGGMGNFQREATI